jgi:hypothetical protein
MEASIEAASSECIMIKVSGPVRRAIPTGPSIRQEGIGSAQQQYRTKESP